jgi:phosphoribosylaminoimidazolecarboxamide formyltransferase/IMP cyclohydrolase
MKKRALISVSDKSGCIAFAQGLVALGYEVLSTGGTFLALEKAGVPVTAVQDVTGFPECLDGRVKTLHPVIHGGILAIRGSADHMAQIEKLGIVPIDVVAINLYPFKATIEKPDVHFEEAIENIDIGGPTMLRSAAKNHHDVAVLVDPADYVAVLEALEADGEVSQSLKFKLALKVFEHTAAYDALISEYLRKQLTESYTPEKLTLTFEKVQDLRYGENPHQQAIFYKEPLAVKGAITEAVQLHGKELSFNNINDANGALELLKEFTEPTVVAVKHTNACGVGTGKSIHDAYLKAYTCDPISIFGGIIACNRKVDLATAEEINKIFLEIVIAPDFDEDAYALIASKKNIRLMKLDMTSFLPTKAQDYKRVSGGLLIQDADCLSYESLEVVTERIPTEKELRDMKFAWSVVKHLKSNAICMAKEETTLAIGPGQVNRIWAVENCVKQANESLKGSVMASDAFFPFSDCVETAVKAGITAIIQPGGSMKDQDSIDMANRYGIAMIFTKMRHFKH